MCNIIYIWVTLMKSKRAFLYLLAKMLFDIGQALSLRFDYLAAQLNILNINLKFDCLHFIAII